jgi:hypothetical protein
MDAFDIREHTIDGAATVFYFARRYSANRSSAAAYRRARAKIGAHLNTSVFRVVTPEDGRQLLIVVSGTMANAKRARERVAWGGEEYSTTLDEITAIGSRFREVAQAAGLNSEASWRDGGGLALGREGSRGPMRRPRG